MFLTLEEQLLQLDIDISSFPVCDRVFDKLLMFDCLFCFFLQTEEQPCSAEVCRQAELVAESPPSTIIQGKNQFVSTLKLLFFYKYVLHLILCSLVYINSDLVSDMLPCGVCFSDSVGTRQLFTMADILHKCLLSFLVGTTVAQ